MNLYSGPFVVLLDIALDSLSTLRNCQCRLNPDDQTQSRPQLRKWLGKLVLA